MQCLPSVRLVRRLATASLAPAGVCQSPSRFSSNYLNKAAKKKVQEADDERWLEAEIDKNILTPEERYAHAREVEALKNMVSQLKEEHRENITETKREHSKEIDDIKMEIKDLQQRLVKLTEK